MTLENQIDDLTELATLHSIVILKLLHRGCGETLTKEDRLEILGKVDEILPKAAGAQRILAPQFARVLRRRVA